MLVELVWKVIMMISRRRKRRRRRDGSVRNQ